MLVNTALVTGIYKKKCFDRQRNYHLDHFAVDDHFNSALLSNYGAIWVILSEYVDSCCLLIHGKQTQLGVGRQCTANRDRESGSFTLSPLTSVFFKKTLSITLSSQAPHRFSDHLQLCSRKIWVLTLTSAIIMPVQITSK